MKTAFHLTPAILLLSACLAVAQMPGAAGPGLDSALLGLFGDITAFSANADVRVLDKEQKEIMAMPLEFSVLDKKIRVQFDSSRMKAEKGSAELESLKQMGLSRMVSIVRPDKKLIYVIYPDQKIVMTMPHEEETTTNANKSAKLEHTPIGKETVEGHACTKNRAVVTDQKGKVLEAITWNAADLKDFPVQIQTTEKENTSIIRFKNVQLTKPDPKEFEVPTGYTQYDNPVEMMQAVTKRMSEAKPK
jgi:hypothetical protein